MRDSRVSIKHSGDAKDVHHAVTRQLIYGMLKVLDSKGKLMPSRLFVAAAATIALLFSITSATAADISIAIGADVTSIDPHYHNLTPNNNIAEHIFETLVTKDPKSLLKPALAVSWKTIDFTMLAVARYSMPMARYIFCFLKLMEVVRQLEHSSKNSKM